MKRPRYTEMVVSILAKKEDLAEDVLYVCHTKQWILMLVSFEQFFILLDEMVSGISV